MPCRRNPLAALVASLLVAAVHGSILVLEIAQPPSLSGSTDFALALQPVVVIKTADGQPATKDVTLADIFVTASLRSNVSGLQLATGLAGSARILSECYSSRFTNLQITNAGTFNIEFSALWNSYTLSVVSNAINVLHGKAFALTINTQPQGVQVNKTFFQSPVLFIQDAHGNVVSSGEESSLQIVVWILSYNQANTSSPKQIRLYPSKASTMFSFEGICKFFSLMITDVARDVKLLFNVTGRADIQPTVSKAFNVFDNPQYLEYDTNIGGIYYSQQVFQRQPVLRLLSQSGILCDLGTQIALTAQLQPQGTTGADAVLSGRITVIGNLGVFQFTDLRVDKSGSYRIVMYISDGLHDVSEVNNVVSPVVTILPGNFSQFQIIGQPGGPTPAAPLADQPIVTLLDASAKNLVPVQTAVTASVLQNGIPLISRYFNTSFVTQSLQGIATFTDVALYQAGSNFTLKFEALGISFVPSTVLTVLPGSPAGIKLLQEPGGASTTRPLQRQPVVAVIDTGRNVVSDAVVYTRTFLVATGDVAAYNVSLEVAESDGSMRWLNASVELVEGSQGITTYSNLRVFGLARTGLALVFQFCSSRLTASCTWTESSSPFTISSAPVSFRLTQDLELKTFDPRGWQQVKGLAVQLQDKDGVPVEWDPSRFTTAVNFSLSLCYATSVTFNEFFCEDEAADPCRPKTSPLHVTVTGTTSCTTSMGACSFGGLFIGEAGVYKFRLRAHGLLNSILDSQRFQVLVGKPSSLLILQQPAGFSPGYPAAVQPVVAISDDFGNTITDACDRAGAQVVVSLVGSTNSTINAARTSFQPQTFMFCVACCKDLQVDGIGRQLQLGFAYVGGTLVGIRSALSLPFDVELGGLYRIIELDPPGRCLVNVTCEQHAAVILQDAGGNRLFDRSFTVRARLYLSTGQPSDLYMESRSASGIAYFSNLRFSRQGVGFFLNYSIAEKWNISAAFAVSNLAHQLSIIVQPDFALPGKAMGQQPVLQVQDELGIPVTSTLGLSPLLQNYHNESIFISAQLLQADGSPLPLLGATRVPVVRGSATFTDLTLKKAATCLGLSFSLATSRVSWAISSQNLQVLAGIVDHIAVLRSPRQEVAGGVFLVQPSVAVLDAGDNILTSKSDALIIATIGAGPTINNQYPSRSFLLGSLQTNSIAGFANFTNMRIDLAFSCWTLRFEYQTVGVAYSVPFAVSPSAPAAVSIVAQPSDGVAGQVLSGQPVIWLLDRFNNLLWNVANSTATVTLIQTSQNNLSTCSNLSTSHQCLKGTTSISQRDSKLAEFAWTDLRIDKISSQTYLRFSVGGILSPLSSRINIAPGAAAVLALLQEPDGLRCNQFIKKPPILSVQDEGGNIVPMTLRATVSLVSFSGREASPACYQIDCPPLLLDGTLTSTSTSGVVSFSDLAFTSYTSTTAQNLRLKFVASPFATIFSRSFDVGGIAARVVLSSLASHGVAGEPLNPQPQVTLLDQSGLKVEWWEGVSGQPSMASMSAILGGKNAVVLGRTSVEYQQGVAVWTDLALEVADPVGYTLSFNVQNLVLNQDKFVVLPASPSALFIVRQSLTETAGDAFTTPPVISVKDQFGNTVFNLNNGSISVEIESAALSPASLFPGPKTLLGNTSSPIRSGIADFANSSLGCMIAASVTLKFSGPHYEVASRPSAPSAFSGFVLSGPIEIAFGQTVKLLVKQSPTIFVAASNFIPQPVVHLLDRGGNTILGAEFAVEAFIVVGSNRFLLATQSAVDGVVTYQNVKYAQTVSGAALEYRCEVACNPSVSQLIVQSAAFDISNGLSASISLKQDLLSSSSSGAPLLQQPVLSLLDAGGRLVTSDSSTTVYVALLALESVEGKWVYVPSLTAGKTSHQASQGLVRFTDLAISGCSQVGNVLCSQYQSFVLRFGTEKLSPSCARYPFSAIPQFPCAGGDTSTFSVQVGQASKLTITQQPAGAAPGQAFAQTPIVIITDLGGNFVGITSPQLEAAQVTVQLYNQQGSLMDDSLLTGDRRVSLSTQSTLPQQLFTFRNLGVRPVGTFFLAFSSSMGFLPINSSLFTITVGPPYALSISRQPGGGTGNSALAVQPIIKVVDQGGNFVQQTAEGVAVTTEILTPNSLLIKPTIVRESIAPVSFGLAQFTSLTIDLSFSCLSLRFTSCLNQFTCNLQPAASAPISVVVGRPARLAVRKGPGPVQQAGRSIDSSEVLIQDLGGNVIFDTIQKVVATVECVSTCSYPSPYLDRNGNFLPAGSTSPPPLYGTLIKLTSMGSIVFTDVAIDRQGGPYVLHFFDYAQLLTSVTTTSFSVLGDVPSRLYVSRQPAGASPGFSLAVQPELFVLDSHGNPIASISDVQVVAELYQGGRPARSLNCDPVDQPKCLPDLVPIGSARFSTVRSGVVSYTDLAVSRAGSNYTFRFSTLSQLLPGSPFLNLFFVDSWPPFDVVQGAAYKVSVRMSLGQCIVNATCKQQPVVTIDDRGGNVVAESTSRRVSVSIPESYSHVSFSSARLNELIIPALSGRATFSGLLLTQKATNIMLYFSSGILRQGFQGNLNITGPATNLRLVQAPEQLVAAGEVFNQPVIMVADADGRQVEAESETQVQAQLLLSVLDASSADVSHSQDLLGNHTVRCCFGLCRFTDLRVGRAGGPWKLEFSMVSAPIQVSSSAFMSRGCYAPVTCYGHGACSSSASECVCDRGYAGSFCDTKLRILRTAELQWSSSMIEPVVGLNLGGGDAIEIPRQNLDLEGAITMDSIDMLSLPQALHPSTSDNFVFAGSIVEFRPEGLQFSEPAAISLGYTIEESKSKKLFLFTFDNTTHKWKRLQEYESVVDTANKVVRGKILHFSFYAVMLQEVAVLLPFNSTVGNQTFLISTPSSNKLTVVYACIGTALGLLMFVGAIYHIRSFIKRKNMIKIVSDKETTISSDTVETIFSEQEADAYSKWAQAADARKSRVAATVKEDALLDVSLNADYQDEDVHKQAWVTEHQKRRRLNDLDAHHETSKVRCNRLWAKNVCCSPGEAGEENEKETSEAGATCRKMVHPCIAEIYQAALARKQALQESPVEFLKEKRMEISSAVKDVGWLGGGQG